MSYASGSTRDCAAWRLEVLGPVDLSGPNARAAHGVLRRPKELALLAFLTVQPGGALVPRERLTALFWPESDEQRARASLRQALRSLRQALGPEVVRALGSVEVGVAPSGISSDHRDFHVAVREGRAREALSLYRGHLLDGYNVRASHEFQDWLAAQRALSRTAAADAAWLLAEAAERAGDAGEAAFFAKRALGFTPFDEPAVQRTMRFLDRVGDRAGALRAFRGLHEHLVHEYGAIPSPETHYLHGQVQDRSSTLGPGTPLPNGRRVAERRLLSDRRVGRRSPPGVERRSSTPRRSAHDRRAGGERRAPL